ncbi:MAG: hypothetical protein IIZ93_05625 [Acidaminococcaceae bacterium]|nr:hypothetical protein [Acidaminococcaceae bacterium]
MMMNDYEQIEGFTFWNSWNEQCNLLSDVDRLDYFDAIRNYVFSGTMPDKSTVSEMVYVLFVGAKANLDSNIKSRINGKKGGRPSKNKEETPVKTQIKTPVKTTLSSTIHNNTIHNINSPKENLEQQNLEFKNNECIDDRESVGKDRGLRGEGKPAQRFTPPSPDDVAEWLWAEKGMAMTEAGPLADRFVSFYESKGWMVGKNKMKSWKAAVSGWIARDRQECQKKQAETFGASDGILYLKQVVGDV